jgi:hypothetical protein
MGFARERESVNGVDFEVDFNVNNVPREVARVMRVQEDFASVADFEDFVARARDAMSQVGMK